ncbi:SRPBCC family protein [Neobacillus sp. CF12]|uniref:SRPBCC family protein n=1 Tax=Neobacillus sp. CF12 TaxID=3055864 RepID=UPI0025A11C15|nr:SRPBCC family protein [Neobacillus sp. CF12]MDM5329029.1 SRPBCC family protein [Neobacillus sp. CF12]
MPVIEHKLLIKAPIEVCFDLARNVEVHTQINIGTKATAVGGMTEGLLEEGDSVTWEAVHFGIRRRLTSKVIFMDKPHSFVNVRIKGAFKSFIQIHQFIEKGKDTIMVDHFQYKSRFGPIGVLIDKLFFEKHMERLIARRAIEFKKIAEKKTNQTFD